MEGHTGPDMIMGNHHVFSVCPNGHENPSGASFCTACGSPMAATPPPVAVSDSPVDARPSSKRRLSLPVIVAAVVGALVIVVGGGYYLWASAEQGKLSEQTQSWNSAVSAVAPEPYVTVSENAITFRSGSKKYCDPKDFMHYDGWGESVNWDSVESCKAQAEVNFNDSATVTVRRIEKFATQVGIPASFTERLTAARGLDGTQQVDFADTKVGPLRAVFSYDGGNGIFVQIERVER